MERTNGRLNLGFIVLTLVLNLWGCTQTPTLIIDDSANYQKHKELIMVPEASGQDTNRELYMDMEGGG
jgi:hypothetical protein